MSPWARAAAGERRDPRPPILCRIRRCEQPARWIVTIAGHPNGDPAPGAYCRQHAEERAGLLWDESPRPYTVRAEGPHEPGELRRVLGPDAAAEHVEAKRQQIAELEAELPPTSARDARGRQ